MICYFREGLKLSIKIEIEQQDQESVNFEEIMQKTINAEAKVGLRSSTMVQDLDIYYSKSHCPSNNIATKVQIQETTVKDSRPKKAKTKDLKSTLFCINAAKFLKQEKKDWKDKKKKFQQKKR